MTQDYISAAIRTETDYAHYALNLTPEAIKGFEEYQERLAAIIAEGDEWKKHLMYGKPKPKAGFLLRLKLAFRENPLSSRISFYHQINVRRALHGSLGVLTEGGELMTAISAAARNCHLDTVNFAEEIGDVFWYVAVICHALMFDPTRIMRQNIRKLYTRYPQRFSGQEAIVRDLAQERKTLEESQ